MMATPVWSAVFTLTVLSSVCQSQQNVVPDATLEFMSPSGLRISIPGDNPAVKSVAFHVNINEEFYGVEHGQYAADIVKKRDGRWTWVIPQLKVRQGDVIYYWINVIEETQSYNGLDREYRVTQGNPPVELPVQLNTPNTTITTPLCTTSQSTLNNGSTPVCQGDVLLDEQFNSKAGWNHRVSIGGDYPEDEFTVFTKESLASWVEEGKLFIKPSLLEDKYDDAFVRSGELQLEGCTSAEPQQCSRRARTFLILPPVISARLNTKGKFSFCHGIVEIRAKLPSGKWIVPELWLEPTSGPSRERVVLGLSRGNTDDSEFGWRNLEVGVVGDTQSSLGKKRQDIPWSQDFHTFKLHWSPGQMKFYVDNQEIHHVASDGAPILNKEVYITLGIHVAGNRDFPDKLADKPWKNSDPKPPVWKSYSSYIIESYDKMERFLRFWDAKNSWHPSWNQDSTLQVDWIKITAV